MAGSTGSDSPAALVVDTQIRDTDTLWNLLNLANGADVAPVLTIGIGLHLGGRFTGPSTEPRAG